MLSISDIKKIGSLARLKLSDAEIVQYRRELASIIEYIDQLQKLKVRTKNSVSKKSTSLGVRSDKPSVWNTDERDLALAQFPHTKGRQLKVPRILA